jgi:DNA modification methylase
MGGAAVTSETFLDGRVVLHPGDSRDVLKTLADNSIDSIVCDPPYALVSIVKRFANSPRSERTENTENPYGRTGRGFMGQKWDNGETAFATDFWAECLRVLKPGGHVVAFSGTRTYHNMASAIERAGFEVRDSILDMFASNAAGAAFLDSLNDAQRSALVRLMDEQFPTGLLGWVYGSGFPKSHDVAKGLGKKLAGPALCEDWNGWGTALKPAWEPIALGRKPLDRSKTVAANVLQYGTGAINIDGCRVGTEESLARPLGYGGIGSAQITAPRGTITGDHSLGRWPANIIHDGSEEVLAAFPETAPSTIGKPRGAASGHGWGMTATGAEYDDSGSAARFFYTSKADADDRLGSKHPTVKPVDLMQWLCRLVTPKGGTVLDPFAGTGTTGEAAFREGFKAVLIEREAEYQADIRRRMALIMAGPDERKRESMKARHKDSAIDAGPLFSQEAS